MGEKYDGIFPEDIQMENMHMKTCLTTFTIREMKMKTIVKYYYTVSRMALMKNSDNTKY